MVTMLGKTFLGYSGIGLLCLVFDTVNHKLQVARLLASYTGVENVYHKRD